MSVIIQPAEDDILCPCSGTTRGEIRALFDQGMDIDRISRRTGALTGCGGCEWDIGDFLTSLQKESDRKPEA